MKFDELISVLRTDFLNDNVAPYLWETETLLNYLIEAEKEACRRASLIIDVSTAEVTQVSLSTGVGSYSLHPSILKVQLASIDEIYPVNQLTVQEFYDIYFNRNKVSKGLPLHFCIQNSANSMLIGPSPDKDYTLNLVVTRLPIETKNETSTPEIPEYTHYDLLYKAAALCYSKQDTDVYNNKKAAEFDALFSNKFGQPLSAKTEVRRKMFPSDMKMRGSAKKFGFM